MGSYRQHAGWAGGYLLFMLLVLVWQYSGETFFFISSCAGLFLLANVFPDIDLDTSTVSKRASLLFPVIRLGIWQRHTTHWGHWHSVVAAVITSIPFLILGWYHSGGYRGMILAGSWVAGYLTHLACDQFYHDTRGKKWKRKAMKLW